MNYEKALKRKYDLLKRLFFPVTCMCALLQYLFNNASLPFSALFWSVNYDKAARGLVISRGTVKSALSVTLQHVSIRIRKDDDKLKVWGSQRKPEDGPTLWWGRNLERVSPPLFHKVFRWFFNHETESESFNNCCLLSVVNLSTGENLQEIKYFLFYHRGLTFLSCRMLNISQAFLLSHPHLYAFLIGSDAISSCYSQTSDLFEKEE